MKIWEKVLSKNDIDPDQSHQSGINATKSGLKFFKQVDQTKEIDHQPIAVVGLNGERLEWNLSWYKSKKEIHITGSGPYLRSKGVGVGDTVILKELDSGTYELTVNGPGFESAIESRLTEALDSLQSGTGIAGQGFISDSKVKIALENHAMGAARAYYEDKGYEVIDTSANNPYDLICERNSEKIFVEVKGTSTSGSFVWLTKNEVETFKQKHPNTALVIVSKIKYQKIDGEVKTTGGETQVIQPWRPEDGQLTATQFRYEVVP